MFASLRNSSNKKRDRSSRPTSRESKSSRKHARRHPRTDSLSGVLSSLSLADACERAELAKCAHFKRNLGKLLKAHGHSWKKVPMFFFVDEWVADDGKLVAKNRLKAATEARHRFGIAN